MSLTPFQKAGLRQHIHNKSQILNDDGTAAIDGGSAAIDAAIAAHAAASDPHPTYDTDAEVATAIGGHAAASNPHPSYLKDHAAITYFDATDAAAPGNPAAGAHRLYAKSDGLYYRDSAGTEVGPLAASSGGGGAFAGTKVYASAAQVLTDTALSFDSEEWDTDGYHNPSSNPTRITIPAGRAGKYLLQAGTFCTGTTRLEFRVNGSANAVRSTGGTISIAGYTALSAMVDLAAGDYVEVIGNAGASRTYGDNTEVGAKSSFVATLMSGVAGPTGADGVPSRLVSWSAFRVNSGSTITMYAPGPLKVGNVLFLAFSSVQFNVSSITQSGVTWTLVDKGDNASGNQQHTELWKGVIGSGAKNLIVVTQGGSNTAEAVVAEFAGFAGTVGTHGNAIQGGGTDLSLGAITSAAGNLIVAALGYRGGTGEPAGSYGGLAGLPGGVVTNQVGTPVNLAWRLSDGTSVTPKMQDTGDNMAGAWAVVTA